ncbi:MAG: TIGR02300 family protein [Holosporaceae bacterium]|jgi:uncharacterized protein (TIGR02300 family)|nr:TIGR02300 family protein [Holosporaceae bacterium]
MKKGSFMDRDDWGTKRICLSCATRFYDFGKSQIICPACGAVFDPEYLLKRKVKTLQEKNDEDIDVVDDGLIDAADDDLDDSDDELVINNQD